MNASDLSCIENLSANQGKRGYRGVTGAKGIPATYGVDGAPGQPGPNGSSRIDITMQGDKPFMSVAPSRPQTVAYLYFPGSTVWGTSLQNLKVACSFNNVGIKEGYELTANIYLVDMTDALNPVDVLSQPLTYKHTVTSANKGTKQFEIVQIGSSTLNSYTTMQNVPTTGTLLQVKVETSRSYNNITASAPTVEIYAIELI